MPGRQAIEVRLQPGDGAAAAPRWRMSLLENTFAGFLQGAGEPPRFLEQTVTAPAAAPGSPSFPVFLSFGGASGSDGAESHQWWPQGSRSGSDGGATRADSGWWPAPPRDPSAG